MKCKKPGSACSALATRSFALRFLPGALVLVCLAALMPWLVETQQRTIIEDQYLAIVGEARHPFNTASARTASVMRLAMLSTTQAFAANASKENAAKLVGDLKAWGLYWPLYTKIRFVGADGMEKVVVSFCWDRTNTELLEVEVDATSQLANVSDAFFFAPSLKLERGSLYVSAFQLEGVVAADEGTGVERAAAAPVLHASAIVFEGNTASPPAVAVATAAQGADMRRTNQMEQASVVAGFMALTVDAAPLLADIAATVNTSRVPTLGPGVGHTTHHVVNSKGYWLDGSDLPPGAAFSWQTPGYENVSFASAEPDLWAAVQAHAAEHDTTQFYHSGSLVTVYRSDVCATIDEDYSITASCFAAQEAETYVVLVVPSEYLLGPGLQPWELVAIVVGAAGVTLWALLSFMWVKTMQARRAAIQRRIGIEEFRSRNKELWMQTMCHEIRTPLNAVVGAISMLAGPDIPPSKAPLVSVMEDASALMMSVLNDILDVGKIESGQLHLAPAAFDVREVLGACVEMHAAAALRKGLDVFLSFGADIPEVLIADDLRIRQMLSNLLSNSIKFTDAGAITISVNVVEEATVLAAAAAEAVPPTRQYSKRVARRAVQPSDPAEEKWVQKPRHASIGAAYPAAAAVAGDHKDICLPSLPAGVMESTSVASEEGRAGPGAAGGAGAPSPGRKILEIRVADTGKGIAPEGLTRIFEPYEQEEVGTTRRYGGTGLGLTICRRLAEAMGGSVHVSSSLGRGSTFAIRMPAHTAAQSPPTSAFPSEALTDSAPLPVDFEYDTLVVAPTPPVLYVAAAEPLCPAHANALAAAVAHSFHPAIRLLETPAVERGVPKAAAGAAAAADAALGAAAKAAKAAAAAVPESGSGGGNGSRSSCGGGGDESAAIAVVVVDTGGIGGDGALDVLAELRRCRTSADLAALGGGREDLKVLVLLSGRWGHLLGPQRSELLEGCNVVTMPVTPAKLERALAAAATANRLGREDFPGDGDAGGLPATDPSPQPRGLAADRSEAVPRPVRSLSSPLPYRGAAASFAASGCLPGLVALDSRRSDGAAAAAAGAARELPPSLPPPLSPPPQLLVLVVDDVAANRRILEHMLVKLGHCVTCAADGDEAVAADANQDPPFHLVFMDLMMPGALDGAQATAHIMQRYARLCAEDRRASHNEGKQLRRAPIVVVLTASALASDQERCLDAGAVAFLTKPLAWQRLQAFMGEDLPRLWRDNSSGSGGAFASAATATPGLVRQNLSWQNMPPSTMTRKSVHAAAHATFA